MCSAEESRLLLPTSVVSSSMAKRHGWAGRTKVIGPKQEALGKKSPEQQTAPYLTSFRRAWRYLPAVYYPCRTIMGRSSLLRSQRMLPHRISQYVATQWRMDVLGAMELFPGPIAVPLRGGWA